MAYLTCKDLNIGYEGTPVAEGLSFSVSAGECLVVLGENGAGKSTLVRTLLRLIRPLSGEMLTGDDLGKNEIGYLPQQTEFQRDFPASVEEIVLSGTLPKHPFSPFYGKEQRQTAKANMMLMNVYDMRKKSFRNLSGGQKQRVLLARALCATERLLLLDEPVSGLDPKVTAEFYQLTSDLVKNGIAVIMVSHDLHSALEIATHVLHIGSRKQLFYGTREEYLASGLGKTFEEGGASE
ncbi:MAG: metal ABC transporter ATP-binding protein [Lachnospiraceae bacterium]|nr:metal ABC transporter ATP-binding protein [Lachnospiraceae bacterium]